MGYKLAAAFIDIEAKTDKLNSQLNKSRGTMMSWLGGLAGLGSTLGIGLGIGAAIAAGRQFIAAAVEAHDAESRLRAVITATGGAANKTAEDILSMASAMQAATGTSDEMITDAASKLLTFKTVTDETFDRALKASADLAATGFGRIQGAAVQLGKALEDPIRGLGALRRAGVSFTEEQKTQIKELVKSGQLLKAQGMIMDAVEGQVKGVAEAMGKTPAGQWKIILAQISDIGEELGKRILPIVVSWGKVLAPVVGGVMAIWDAVSAVNEAMGGFLFWWTAIPKYIEMAKSFLAPIIPILQAAGEKIRYAFGRVLEVIKVVRDAIWNWIVSAAEGIANAFGTSLQGVQDGFMGFLTWAIEGIAELAMDAAEWALVLVTNFDTVTTAIWSGLKFIGGATWDILVGSFKAAFQTFIDIATRVFAMIPRLMQAGFEGGLAGMAAQLNQELVGAIMDGSRNLAKNTKFSEFTKNAQKDMNKAAVTLALAKAKLEQDRPGMKVPEAAKIAKEPPPVAEVIHKLEFPSGLMGITDAWKNLQEAMLKQDSPEERSADALEHGEELWQKQVDAQLETNSKLDKMLAVDGVV
jgi:hypothetical protein